MTFKINRNRNHSIVDVIPAARLGKYEFLKRIGEWEMFVASLLGVLGGVVFNIEYRPC